MKNVATWLMVIVGVVLLAVAGLGVAGLGPASTVPVPPGGLNCGTATPTPVVAFIYSAPANSSALTVTPQICLPGIVTVGSSYNASVTWGDGTSTPVVSTGPIMHTYLAHSSYNVTEFLYSTVVHSCLPAVHCTPSVQLVTYVVFPITLPSEKAVSGAVASGCPSNLINTINACHTTQHVAYIIPAFTYTTSNLTVTVRDNSSAVNETISAISWNFGDGTTPNPSANSATHTYAKAGTYTITEYVTGMVTGNNSINLTPSHYQTSTSVTVNASVKQTCGSACAVTGAGSAEVTVQSSTLAVAIGLVGAGFLLGGLFLLWRPDIAIIVVIALFIAGVAYYFVV
jgi:hypothetical protein